MSCHADKTEVLMTSDDEISSQSNKSNLPYIRAPPRRLEVRRELGSEEYMSGCLINALENRVDWNIPRNLEYFDGFAKELHSFQLRNDKFEVLGRRSHFRIHNISRDYNYRQSFEAPIKCKK
jgi:hypothetical protein